MLRAVLGDAEAAYYGGSYGTFLGAWYAQEFPWRVGPAGAGRRRGPVADHRPVRRRAGEGFQRGLRAYVAGLPAAVRLPAARHRRGGVRASCPSLIAHADQHPLRTSTARRPLTQSLLVTGLAMGLYDDRLWPALTKGISEAMTGRARTLLALADLYNERDSQGRYSQVSLGEPGDLLPGPPRARDAAADRRASRPTWASATRRSARAWAGACSAAPSGRSPR